MGVEGIEVVSSSSSSSSSSSHSIGDGSPITATSLNEC